MYLKCTKKSNLQLSAPRKVMLERNKTYKEVKHEKIKHLSYERKKMMKIENLYGLDEE